MGAPGYIQLFIVIYPSECSDVGAFTAHCLNMDLIADDDTVEGAVDLLLELISTTMESGAVHKANCFRDAPRKYWEKLEHAKRLPLELIERIISRRKGVGGLPAEAESFDVRQLEVA